MPHQPTIDAARFRLERADELCQAARVLHVQDYTVGAFLLMREAASQLLLAPAAIQILRMPEQGLLGRPLTERAAVLQHSGALPPLSDRTRGALRLIEEAAGRLQSPEPLDTPEPLAMGGFRGLEEAYDILREAVVAALPHEVTLEPDDAPSPL